MCVTLHHFCVCCFSFGDAAWPDQIYTFERVSKTTTLASCQRKERDREREKREKKKRFFSTHNVESHLITLTHYTLHTAHIRTPLMLLHTYTQYIRLHTVLPTRALCTLLHTAHSLVHYHTHTHTHTHTNYYDDTHISSHTIWLPATVAHSRCEYPDQFLLYCLALLKI